MWKQATVIGSRKWTERGARFSSGREPQGRGRLCCQPVSISPMKPHFREKCVLFHLLTPTVMMTFEVLGNLRPRWGKKIAIWYRQHELRKISNKSSRLWTFQNTEEFFKKLSQAFKGESTVCGYCAKETWEAWGSAWRPPCECLPSTGQEAALRRQRRPCLVLVLGASICLSFPFQCRLLWPCLSTQWAIFWYYYVSSLEKCTYWCLTACIIINSIVVLNISVYI